jgi:hypothetical protein
MCTYLARRFNDGALSFPRHNVSGPLENGTPHEPSVVQKGYRGGRTANRPSWLRSLSAMSAFAVTILGAPEPVDSQPTNRRE